MLLFVLRLSVKRGNKKFPDPDAPDPEFGVMLSQQLPGLSGDSDYTSWSFFSGAWGYI